MTSVSSTGSGRACRLKRFMKAVLQAFNPEGLTDADRSHPKVQEALRERFRRAIGFSVMSIPITSLGVAAVLWRHSSHWGLILWVALTLLSGANYWAGFLSRPDGDHWRACVVMLQVYGGFAWASVALLAMPEESEWQLFLTSFLMGVFAANVLFSSHFRSTFYSFMIPLAVVSIAGFLLNGSGVGRWGALLLAYGALFSMGLSEISRASDVAASVFAARNAELADGLKAEQAQLHDANVKLAQQASTDDLTQLPNRFEFLRQLDLAVANHAEPPTHSIAVAYLDLDGFKAVNDSLGHDIGDLLLIAVGERLSACLRPTETVARLGGDELVVLATAAARDGGARELGNRIKDCFARPFVLGSRSVDCGCSVGVALFEKSMAAAEVMRLADVALYSAKANGGGDVEVFGSDMRASVQERHDQCVELCDAFRQGQIVPYVQPVVDLRTGAIVGGEALARWEHPEGVRVAGSFIELAGEIGIVDELNKLVIEQIVDLTLRIEAATGLEMPIGVNVTFRGLEAVVEHFMSSAALDTIVIEVSDKVPSLSTSEVRAQVERAREMGVSVLLNDFGTGIASMAVAMELPVDGLKIDHKFISELYEPSRGASVASALIELANRLNLEIVAEGVESAEQLALLRRYGVRFGQGFHFAPAVPLATFHEWVTTNKTFSVSPEATTFSGSAVS